MSITSTGGRAATAIAAIVAGAVLIAGAAGCARAQLPKDPRQPNVIQDVQGAVSGAIESGGHSSGGAHVMP